ncbi:MAG: DNA-processing protein DprA [Bacteroidaceae bacterium]|nr:DNA-processing protein DprA [Bacteroidaceae bacterium]
MTNEQELIYTIALSRLPKISLANCRILYDQADSVTEIWNHRNNIKEILPDASERLINALQNMDECVKRAEKEMEFISNNNIKTMCIGDADYPSRLIECDDAPLVLFQCGNADLNVKHVINVVGTRKCTQYGKEICQSLISGLKQKCPDILVVSGLAYGIDIHAHRAALKNGMTTVGVLAHGLDRIYPAVHRKTAAEMVNNGGLLTEYLSETNPDRINFIRRNRIVAGISDATIVVESANKGGSLITAELAADYNRDVFAYPGRAFDEYSAGCNRLISEQKASLIQSEDDLLRLMGWEDIQQNDKPKATQQELFINLNDEQQRIVTALKDSDGKQINQIIVETGLNYMQVSSQLYELECMGVIALLGGARYKVIRQ